MKAPGTIVCAEPMLFRVPLDEPLGDAMHGTHTHFELVILRIETAGHVEGFGYTYTGGVGGTAIYHLLADEIVPALLGQDAFCIEAVWNMLAKKLHYIGRGGIDSFALACADIALWDIRCKSAGMPLWQMAGGFSPKVRAYAGGIDLDYSLEKLVDHTKNYLRSGHTAVKIKIGRETLSDDLQRVAAVRAAVGPDTVLMVDANYKWTAAEAVRACRALQPYNLFWIEEPVSPDDIEGYRAVSDLGGIPIACGENFHSLDEFHHMLKFGAGDFLQPDASNVGGITPWLKVAALCQACRRTVCTHGMQELHVSLLAAVPNAGWLEVHSFPIDRYTTRPLTVREGIAQPPEVPGTGVVFRFDLLAPYRIQ